jgi:hypothetical protein
MEYSDIFRDHPGAKKEDIVGDPRKGKAYLRVKGSGINAVYVDLETGESTEEVHELRKISKYDECDHYYIQIDDHNIQCRICELGHQFVLGLQHLENGKIVNG